MEAGIVVRRPVLNSLCFPRFLHYVNSVGRFKHSNPGFHRFRGYIAYSPVRARARGSLAVLLCVAQLYKFQGKHRLVLTVSLGMSLCVTFRSSCSGILRGMCSREHSGNLQAACHEQVHPEPGPLLVFDGLGVGV